jgi:dTDP-4-amino-4,6-dideoxygalactose transaminase
MIPFNKPFVAGREFEYIEQAIANNYLSGDGLFTKRCQAELEQELGAPKTLLTTSCTHALEMAALLLNVQPSDEIIVPSFTFVSTVNAFVLRGARPVFVDIRPDTLNMDETKLERLIKPSTRAIVPVHYSGVGCEMNRIMELAEAYGVAVVEDAAHALFGKYRDKALGTFGSLAALSFHETKNLICGEGGALVINDTRYVERAEIIREKGTDRSRFFRGQVDKYSWLDIGSSYVLSDILAAFLYAQLEARGRIQELRKRIWMYYYENLQGLAGDVQLPHVPPDCEQPFHMFYLLMASAGERDEVLSYLREREINAVFHYLPLHLSKMGRRFGGKPGEHPVTEDVSARLIRLPFYNELKESEQAKVVEAIYDFVVRKRGAAKAGH